MDKAAIVTQLLQYNLGNKYTPVGVSMIQAARKEIKKSK